MNIANVAALRNEGKMHPMGEAAFALRLEAKSGVYAHEQSNIPELDVTDRERFENNAAAWAYFQATPPGYRKTILHWITKAKRQETRRKRLEQLMQACAACKRLS